MSYVSTGQRRGIAGMGSYGSFGFDVPGTCPDGYSWSWGDCVSDTPLTAQSGGAAAAAAVVEDRGISIAEGCKANSSWTGKACTCHPGFVLVGTDCVPPQPGGGCPPGYMKDQYGNCSIDGSAFCAGDDPNSIYRASDNACICKPGYHRPKPEADCVKTTGGGGGGGGQPVAKACPAGTTGVYPNCTAVAPAPQPGPAPGPNKAWVLAAVGGGALLLIGAAVMMGGPQKKKRPGDPRDDRNE